MTIRLLMMGKNKETYLDQAIADFAKKIRPFCKLELHYLKDERVSGEIDIALRKEGERILKYLKKDEWLMVCDEQGRSFSTTALSHYFSELMNNGVSQIAVAIGSAHGLSSSVKKRANFLLSLSSLTMSHQVVRLVFLEQLYRIFTVQRGMKYHK